MNDDIKDLVIIGAGPSALTAAIYAAREDIDVTIYEKSTIGGLVAIIDKVDNYPGFSDGVVGMDLVDQFEKQARLFGAKIEYGEVTAIKNAGDYKIVIVDGHEVKTRAILIATGRSYGKVGVPGEDEYFGKGVHYCATCDGAFYRNKRLVVVGGANSAIQEAMYLTRFAAHIDLLVRSTIKATQILQHELQKYVDDGKITIHLNTAVDEIVATDDHVSSVRASHGGKTMEIDASGVFIFVGLNPNTEFLKNSDIQLSDRGFIKTDANMQTNIPGIFASGDVRDGSTRQISSAAGEGVTAAVGIREYLNSIK